MATGRSKPATKQTVTRKAPKKAPAKAQKSISPAPAASSSELDHYRDVFRPFEKALHEMERRMDRLLQEAFAEGHDWIGLPLMHGLSLQPGPQGRPVFQPFGSLGQSLSALQEGWREPFLTWHLDDKKRTLQVRAEMPGVSKDGIKVQVTGDAIEIEGEGDGQKYLATCAPGAHLDPERTSASYDNGVLNLTVHLLKPTRTKPKPVKVK